MTERIYFPVPDGAVCAYCPDPATGWDHVRPIAWGGEDEPHNMVPCCWPCNQAKRGQPAELFRLDREQREAWLLERGWLRTRDLPRDPDEPGMAVLGGRRFWVLGVRDGWWDPITGKPHTFKHAQRIAAWGSDAAPVRRHPRRRYW